MLTNDIGTKSSTYTIDNSYEKWVLQSGDKLTSSADGISESSNWHDNVFVLNGTITAGSDNYNSVLESNGDHATITVGADAKLSGQYGLEAYGERDTITVNGEITASRDALYIFSNNATIVNNGTLTGNTDPANYAAVDIGSDTKLSFTNNGTISGGVTAEAANLHMTFSQMSVIHGAVGLYAETGQVTHLVNEGSIDNDDGGYAVYAMEGRDSIVNHGSIVGGVSLGAGNDVHDGRGGTVGEGDYVDGGSGDDTFIVDTRKIVLYEVVGDGSDTVKSTVSFSLDVKYGWDLENLTLLGHGNTRGDGNSLDNVLKGNSGNNRLSGAEGDDMLTGAGGADTFVFAKGFGKDTVSDFKNGIDHIDLRNWTGVDSFADLKAHHLTISGDDLVIQNGMDTLTLHDTQKSELDASDFLF